MQRFIKNCLTFQDFQDQKWMMLPHLKSTGRCGNRGMLFMRDSENNSGGSITPGEKIKSSCLGHTSNSFITVLLFLFWSMIMAII